jgi:phospholipid/cholesterol/gamma-HCH transport system ATP-binding protein
MALSSSPASATERQPVLEFRSACLPDDTGMPTRPVDLTLPPGSLTLIDTGDRANAAAIADAAVGLLPPLTGRVLFLGRDWTQTAPLHANAMRGRIGHSFATGNWLPGVDMLENILLPQLYHTRRNADDLREEAARLAAMFGFPGLPLGDPRTVGEGDRLRAACVRAFLGRPKLIILEHVAGALLSAFIEPLINAVRAARDREAAVLWLTAERDVWSDASIPADAWHRLRGGALHRVARGA